MGPVAGVTQYNFARQGHDAMRCIERHHNLRRATRPCVSASDEMTWKSTMLRRASRASTRRRESSYPMLSGSSGWIIVSAMIELKVNWI